VLEQRAQVEAVADAQAYLLALQAVQAMAQAAPPGGVDLVAQHPRGLALVGQLQADQAGLLQWVMGVCCE
jgi:hypothetical protein